ncbi:MAG: SDR family oxidoreductase [Anaerolineae bacterium]|nr:SDR family oxidoreductase [Anaerolineae bacterium]
MSDLSVKQLFDLTGKVAIVTGAAMGIGKAIANRLSEAGASVMITDINIDAAQKTADEFKALGRKVAAMKADASDPASSQQVVKAAVEQFGGLDILVNNAGIFPMSPMFDISEAEWDKVIDVNLKGLFFFSQAAAKVMVEKGMGGKIVNIASIDGLHPSGNLVHYDSSKGGVIMATRAMALELGPQKIHVNAIAPGGIRTPGASKIPNLTPEQAKAILDGMLQRIPLRRQGDPDDIARAALFLASPAADYVTGEILVVDGGYLVA